MQVMATFNGVDATINKIEAAFEVSRKTPFQSSNRMSFFVGTKICVNEWGLTAIFCGGSVACFPFFSGTR